MCRSYAARRTSRSPELVGAVGPLVSVIGLVPSISGTRRPLTKMVRLWHKCYRPR